MVNTADLHEETSEFRRKFNEQTMFCLPHYKQLLRTAVKCLDKKAYAELAEDAVKIENAYLDKLKNDVSWFCKKFDYNYENEPWYDSKDAVERSIRFLSGNVELK
jgi:transglutaminase-like putative cysteine protease